jgi:hypothetical protein
MQKHKKIKNDDENVKTQMQKANDDENAWHEPQKKNDHKNAITQDIFNKGLKVYLMQTLVIGYRWHQEIDVHIGSSPLLKLAHSTHSRIQNKIKDLYEICFSKPLKSS